MTDEQKVELAAQVLAEVDPTKDNLAEFFKCLESESESVYQELISRIEQIPE